MLLPLSTRAEEALAAQFVSLQVPNKMVIGQFYPIKVMVKNAGTTEWRGADGFRVKLSSDNNSAWEDFDIRIEDNVKVQPGSTHAFEGRIRAPQSAGLYPLRWRMYQRTKAFGELSELQDVVVETAGSRVKFVTQLVPQDMAAGQEYNLVIQFKNQSGNTWRAEDGIELALVSNNANAWGLQRVKLEPKEVVQNNEIATFNFTLHAPEQPGQYNMQWRLSRDNSPAGFGEATPLLNITVTDGAPEVGAEFVFQSIPGIKKWVEFYTIFEPGKVYPVTLTFKNVGRKTWTSSEFRLGARDASAETTWSIDQVELKPQDSIKPGEIKSFSFKVIAPLTPGIYPFQWQLQKGKNEWVGESSDKVMVTVR